jgi:hypothetical protein
MRSNHLRHCGKGLVKVLVWGILRLYTGMWHDSCNTFLIRARSSAHLVKGYFANMNLRSVHHWSRTWSYCLLAGLLGLVVSIIPVAASTLTVQSDANTLAAALGSGEPSPSVLALLDAGDTTGLTFESALVGSYGTFTPVPSGAPLTTSLINIAPGDGENGFFKVTFTLPSGFTNSVLTGAANVDDLGRVFLNGHAISPSLTSGDPNTIWQYGDTAFSTSDASFFNVGVNELLVADCNTGGGPSGAAFFANVSYDAVPEPAFYQLGSLLALGGLSALRMRRSK